MSFAKITVVGHLGGDPETRHLDSGTMIVSFSIAADGRKRGNDSGTTWYRVSAFGEQAERIASMVERGYIKKGSLLYVEGQFEVRGYTGNDGMPRTSNDVNLTDWQFIGGGQQDGNQQASSQQARSSQSDDNMDGVPF